MSDEGGILQSIESSPIWKIFGTAFSIGGIVFIFLFGGSIGKALLFIGAVWFFDTISKIGDKAIRKLNKRRKKRGR